MSLIKPSRRLFIAAAPALILARPANAWWKSIEQVGVSSGGGATTTWNPADKNAAITLSGGNLIETQASDPGNEVGVRAIASHSTGKFYHEIVITVASNLGNVIPGICTAAASLAAIMWTTADGFGYQPNSGVLVINNAVLGVTAATAAVGDVISLAIDLTNLSAWIRVNAGNWNNSGTANPTTNTGGQSLSTLNAGPYFPYMNSRNTGDSATANFGGSAYAQSVPSGFGNW